MAKSKRELNRHVVQVFNAMWERFRRAAVAANLPIDWRRVNSFEHRRELMMHWIYHRRALPDWTCESVIEVAILNHDQFSPAPCPRPTSASPGSCDKVRVLAWRVLHGVELFHPQDNVILSHR